MERSGTYTLSSFHLGSAEVVFQVAELQLALSFAFCPIVARYAKLTFEG